MFSNAEIVVRVVETPTSRTTIDRIIRVPVGRSGGAAVRYQGQYFNIRGGHGRTTPYIALTDGQGRA